MKMKNNNDKNFVKCTCTNGLDASNCDKKCEQLLADQEEPEQETIEKINNRFIIVDGSLSHHCCFCYTIVDTKEGKETYGDYWKKSMCETFDKKDAEIICNALNKL